MILVARGARRLNTEKPPRATAARGAPKTGAGLDSERGKVFGWAAVFGGLFVGVGVFD
jgi:hypothetical protein